MSFNNLLVSPKGLAILIVLILTLVVYLTGFASAAETAVVSVTAPGQAVAPGEQFTVSLTIEPNNAIAGAQFNLAFDPSIVTANSVEEGGLLTQDGANSYFNAGEIDNETGTIKGVFGAIISPGQTVSATGTFAVITLTAGTEGGTCLLALSNVVIGDIEGQSVPVSVINGTVSVNRPPVLNTIGNKTVSEGGLLTFTISASDPDGDSLTYSASNLPDGASFDQGTRTFSWTPGYDEAGTYTGVHFEVSDGNLTDTEGITITVNNNNQPPVLNTIGNKTVSEGGLLTFTISASDPDGDNLTYSASNLPDGASFDQGTRTFSWTPGYDQSGVYNNIHFEVSDGEVHDSEDITIIVNGVNEPYDVNNDGAVNVLDMISVGQHWGEEGTNGWMPEDINEDGIIDVLDSIIIGQYWTEQRK
jgi:hypothetical protein